MRNKLFIIVIVHFCVLTNAQAQSTIPRLVKNGNTTQLLVDNKPFLILGGELGNSSASSNEYMRPIWPRLQQMNLNTVIAPVYWELMEPIEGKFDFALVDSLIKNARLFKMKLVILWFGAWKNSMSCYAPAWVKKNTTKFPRILDKTGNPHEIITPFNKNNLEADKKAFVRLMQYIKETDSKEHTVITVQVENEIGMLPDARTYDEAANVVFNKAVPEQLFNYLKKNKNSLLPEIKSIWEANGSKTSGNWEDVFGKGLSTDEIFMAWYYAVFANELAIAGKDVYSLPMFVNAALNRPGAKPGQYPSAGPLPHVMDIWKAAAPAIDFLTPDFYNPDFKHWCDLYTRAGDPLFIPEHRFEKARPDDPVGQGIDAKAFFAFGNYNCLAFSPFSIESTNEPEQEPIGKTYNILNQLAPLITKYQSAGAVKGFLIEKDSIQKDVAIGDYLFTVHHEYKMGWSPGSKESVWPLAGGLIIAAAPDEFYIAGTGFVMTFTPKANNKKAGFISVDEGRFENGIWKPGRRMNGDQDHQGRHVRIPANDHSIQHVKLYTY
jgi:beta-galactosidase GanA